MKSLRTKIGQLHIYDFLKGAFIAAIAAPLETLLEYLDKGELPFGLDWKKIALTFTATFLGYLLKQFLTGTTGKILVPGKKSNTMSNFFCAVKSYNDIVVGTGLTVTQWVAANQAQGYYQQDGPETPVGYPNVGFPGNVPPSTPSLNLEDSATLQHYTRDFTPGTLNGMPNHRPTL